MLYQISFRFNNIAINLLVENLFSYIEIALRQNTLHPSYQSFILQSNVKPPYSQILIPCEVSILDLSDGQNVLLVSVSPAGT